MTTPHVWPQVRPFQGNLVPVHHQADNSLSATALELAEDRMLGKLAEVIDFIHTDLSFDDQVSSTAEQRDHTKLAAAKPHIALHAAIEAAGFNDPMLCLRAMQAIRTAYLTKYSRHLIEIAGEYTEEQREWVKL